MDSSVPISAIAAHLIPLLALDKLIPLSKQCDSLGVWDQRIHHYVRQMLIFTVSLLPPLGLESVMWLTIKILIPARGTRLLAFSPVGSNNLLGLLCFSRAIGKFHVFSFSPQSLILFSYRQDSKVSVFTMIYLKKPLPTWFIQFAAFFLLFTWIYLPVSFLSPDLDFHDSTFLFSAPLGGFFMSLFILLFYP